MTVLSTKNYNQDLLPLVSKEYVKSISKAENKEISSAKFIKNQTLMNFIDLIIFYLFFLTLMSVILVVGASIGMLTGLDERENLNSLAVWTYSNVLWLCVSSVFGVIGSGMMMTLGSSKQQQVKQVITPQIAFIEQTQVEDKLSLKIINHNKDIIREKFFDIEDENELLVTVVEWENELLDLIHENENIVSEVKAELLFELEDKEHMNSLQQTITPLVNDSNHKLAQAINS